MRRYVRQQKLALGLKSREVCNPQSYRWSQEGQVDGYEAQAILGGEPKKLQMFAMRGMASGGAFHRAYTNATQQAFLEAHELAFAYFGGVFATLRYDNLGLAVKKILRGYQRQETERMLGFRSHWGFQSEYCNPARGNEKGGVGTSWDGSAGAGAGSGRSDGIQPKVIGLVRRDSGTRDRRTNHQRRRGDGRRAAASIAVG